MSRLSSWSVLLVVCAFGFRWFGSEQIYFFSKWHWCVNYCWYFAFLFNFITSPRFTFANAFSHLGNDICLQKNVWSHQSLWLWHELCISWMNFSFFWQRNVVVFVYISPSYYFYFIIIILTRISPTISSRLPDAY